MTPDGPRPVVVVTTHTATLGADERRSLLRVLDVLGGHRIVVAVPESLDVSPLLAELPDPAEAVDLTVMPLPDEFWGSAAAHDRMLRSSRFYERFAEHTHVLVHHLDAYVFRDDLLEWCAAGYDYVGAPWFEGFSTAGSDAPTIGVGNGGFSLRKVDTFLRLTRLFDAPPRGMWRWARAVPYQVRAVIRQVVMPVAGWLHLPHGARERMFVYLSRGARVNEDMLWGLRIAAHLPWFRVSPATVGARFAFEMQPRRLYEMCGHELPFGCHGWPRYEPEFWREHIAP